MLNSRMSDSLRLNLRVLRSRLAHIGPAHSALPPHAAGDVQIEIVNQFSEVIDSMPNEEDQDNSTWDNQVIILMDKIVTNQQDVDWSVVSYAVSVMLYLANKWKSEYLINHLIHYAQNILNHREVRVRLLVSEVLQALAANIATGEQNMKHTIFSALASFLAQRIISLWKRLNSTRTAVLGNEENVPMDDTTGWGTLESDLKAIQSLVLGVASRSPALAVSFLHSTSFSAPVDVFNPIQERNAAEFSSSCDGSFEVSLSNLLISHATQHMNRHLRENSFKFISQLFASSDHIDPMTILLQPDHPHFDGNGSACTTSISISDSNAWFSPQGENTVNLVYSALLHGLQDDWSQIRHAASLGCQALLMTLTSADRDGRAIEGELEARRQAMLGRYWPGILPRLCMNRFYPAASIHSVSQNTWQVVFLPNMLGRSLLILHSEEVVSYYCAMTEARNHMTSEAACQAIAEFIGRIDYSVVLPHIPTILNTLLACLNDDRWPVRDAAIVASGVLARYFAWESISPLQMKKLIEHWTNNLSDFIWSVREHAAIAFGDALQINLRNPAPQHTQWSAEVQINAVKSAALAYIRQKLFYVIQDSVETSGASSTPKVRNFLPEALLKSAARNKGMLVTATVDGQTEMYDSANSLDNKVNARKGWGCCIDCIELRTCLPWEVSHGAVYLLREVSSAMPSILTEPISDEFTGSKSSASHEVLFDALLRLLDITTVAKAAPPLSSLEQKEAAVVQQGYSLLAAALLREIPTILLAAVRAFKVIYKDLTDVRNNIQLPRIVAILERVFRAAEENPAHGKSNSTPTAPLSAAAKRAQQARLRSDRGKDKVLAAVEQCLTALPSALAGLNELAQNTETVRADFGDPELRFRAQLVDMFSEDLRDVVQRILV